MPLTSDSDFLYKSRYMTELIAPMKETKMKGVSKITIPNVVLLSRGLYARVGRKVGCDASYVSRVARRQRRSVRIETALQKEFNNFLARIEGEFTSFTKVRHGGKSRGKVIKNRRGQE